MYARVFVAIGRLAACIGLLAVSLVPRPGAVQASQASGERTQLSAKPAPHVPRLLLQQVRDLGYEIYQVRKGDTVENIAARFGLPPEQIRSLNSLLVTATLEPGQSLAIPLASVGSRRQAASPAAPPSQPGEPLPEGRYAIVARPSPILSEPSAATGQLLYQPQAGTQLVVTAEREHWWGVVMADGSTGWIDKSALQMTDQTIAPEQLELMLRGGRPDIVQEALRYLGTPYRYGGRLPENVDCSLFVQCVFAARGIPLPRTAAAQFEIGRRLSYAELLPGDRVYFIGASGRINHAGIYLGEGRFIHASSSRRCVAVDNLADPHYWSRFLGACRS